MSTTAIRITHDDLQEQRKPRRFFATSDDAGVFLAVTEPTEPTLAVFAEAQTTGLLVRVVRTGFVPGPDGQVRVRIIPARDAGDQAGTLVFDPANGFGGIAPEAMFDRD